MRRTLGILSIVHLTDAILAPLRARYGEPAVLEWVGDITEQEHATATYNPLRTHDVTLFILDPRERIALIRKHPFPPDIWRPPGGGVKPGEDFVDAVVREAYEETALHVELDRYLVESRAQFLFEGKLDWRTHVFLARTTDEDIRPIDTEEIAAARWGTLDELRGPLRERLLGTGRAFWRYRVALHDAALAAL